MKTPKNLDEIVNLHLDDHAILLEMIHTLAEQLGYYFQPTEDGGYELREIVDKWNEQASELSEIHEIIKRDSNGGGGMV